MAASERVPAWKRMGLTLKNPTVGAAEAGSGTLAAVGPVGHPSRTTTANGTNGSKGTNDNDSTTKTPVRQSHKRRLDPPHTDEGDNHSPSHDHSNINSKKHKKPRTESSSQQQQQTQQTPKKVTFAEGTAGPSPSPASHSKPATPSNQDASKQKHKQRQSPEVKDKGKKKGNDSPATPGKKAPGAVTPKKERPPPTPADIKPALEYLRQWKSSRDSWKFNKNHQTTLIRHAFEPHLIPAADIDIFYDYIRDLKGLVRTRLREAAMEIQMRDVEDGYAAFPESDDAMDMDEQQTEYESIVADILRRRRQQQQNPAKRKYFSETQYVAESSADGNSIIIHRLVKRMRAEMIIDELSDGETTDSSMASTASSKTMVSEKTQATNMRNAGPAIADPAPRVKINEAAAGKRRRKLRVNMDDDDTSSSESDSDSDSDDTSSSSGSDSGSDTSSSSDSESGVDRGVPPHLHETSDSSSSSGDSSSESDSDSDDSDEDDD